MDKLHPLAARLALDMYDLFSDYLPADWLTDPDYHLDDLTLWLAVFADRVETKKLSGFDLLVSAQSRALAYYNDELKQDDLTLGDAAFIRFWLELALLRTCRADCQSITGCYAHYDLMVGFATLNLN